MSSLLRMRLWILFLGLSFIYGLSSAYEHYFLSKAIIIYAVGWIFVIYQFFVSKIYREKIAYWQFIALIPLVIILFAGWRIVGQNLRLGGYLFAITCFLYSGCILLNARLKAWKIVFILMYIINAFNLIAVLFFIGQRSIINRQVINVLFITNDGEAKEYLSVYSNIWHLVTIVLFGVATYFLFKRTKESYQLLNPKPLKIFFVACFILTASSGSLEAITVEYLSFLKNRDGLRKMLEDRKKGYHANFKVQTDSAAARKIIIVLGESLNSRYMGMYGYPENTTPFLSEKLKTGNVRDGKLYAFNDVISPEVQTVESILSALTNSSASKPLSFDKAVSVIDIFNQAGYETVWISNQRPYGPADSPIAVIASSASQTYYSSEKPKMNAKLEKLVGHLDEELVKELVSRFKKDKKQIFFVHLMGSHSNYVERYPAEFEKYKPVETSLTNQYLNTVLYNDYVLKQIFHAAEQHGADLVYYFSDHGEALGDAHNPAKYRPDMSKIPYMVYLSGNYLSKHPALDSILPASRNIPAMSDHFFHDIQLISGVRSSLYDPKSSFLTKDYVRYKRRVVGNSIPYDK